MRPFSRFNAFVNKLPINLVLIVLCLVWLIPTLGVLITSFRVKEDVRTSGWWTFLNVAKPAGSEEYTQYCASCHGEDGSDVSGVALFSKETVDSYPRSNRLLAMLRKPVNGQPHLSDPGLPENAQESLAALNKILEFLQSKSGTGVESRQHFTLSNYADAIVGYKGTQDYITDCEQQVPSALTKFSCTARDILNPEGMGRAFLNTIAVAVPSTVLPIILAAFAAYAFSWMDFKGRQWLFAILVGLQIIPLQMTLVPISRMYVQLGMESTFWGIWLFHTGFGLPYAIYLMRNFLGSLPREIFESAYLDGANHWKAFWQLAIPLSTPAIASLGIYQFLWIWNDFLVAKIFLPTNPVFTVQITNLIDPRGGNWHILTGAAFISFIVPMAVFFAFQRFFVRGMMAGAVKG